MAVGRYLRYREHNSEYIIIGVNICPSVQAWALRGYRLALNGCILDFLCYNEPLSGGVQVIRTPALVQD